MQATTGGACGAEYIVTKNVRDYERSPIFVIDPQQALTLLFCLSACCYERRAMLESTNLSDTDQLRRG